MSTDSANTWTSFSSGITNGWVQTLAIKGDTIFAGSNYSGIFSTALNENNWIADTIGLIYNNVVTIASNGNNIYAGGKGIYLSTDNGISWNPANNGFADIIINDVAIKDNKIVVSSPNGVYESTNNGDNWSSIGLTGFQIYTLGISDSNIFAQYYYQENHHPFNVYSGVYLTSNNGNSWTSPNLGFDYFNALVKSGGNIYVGTEIGVFMLTKNGNSWISINIGLVNINVSTIAIKGNTLYAGTNKGIFMSLNNGDTWVSKNNGLADTIISALAVIGDTIFAGTSYDYVYNVSCGIYRSIDNGDNWTSVNTGLPDSTYIRSIITKGNAIFALTGKGVYLSTNNGNNWTSINTGIPSNVLISSIAINDNYIFAGTYDIEYNIGNSVWKRKLSDVLLPENAGLISGITNVCKPQNSVTYTVPAISYATSYIWTFPNGIIDTTSTNSITINIDSTFISGFIKVKGINICGQGNENTIYLNVTNVPLTPYIIGLPNPQPFSSELYSVSQQLGKIYNWTVTDGNIINGLGTNYINVQWGNTEIGKVSISIADSNNTNCTSSSNLIVNIGNVGIETLESDKVVNIYPNPASSELTIETNSNLELRIEIINFIGQTVYSTNINKRATLDISLLQKGIYILKLNTCKEIIVRKFIKE